MNIKYRLLCLIIFAVEACTGQTEDVNATVESRRDILEKQALRTYQNACYGMQELSNWMSVVFKIKSVWAGATISHMEENSGRNLDTGQRKNSLLPPRPKSMGSECSLRNAQVTLQTYAHLQSQLIYLKTLLGRSFLKSSSERLGDANISLRERLKVLDVFNETLNDIFSKLKRDTREISTQARSENWNGRNMIQDFQEGRLLKLLQIPSNIFQIKPEAKKVENFKQIESKPRGFFQTLGKTLDKILFPSAVKRSEITREKTVVENPETSDDNIKPVSFISTDDQTEYKKTDD